jgi:glycosyltransferase involved in cell wall biosynthesis
MNKAVSEPEILRSLRSEPRATRKICIVTGELEGPFFNGGVGTSNRALALELRNLGHAVDILYTHVENGEPFSIRGKFADHVASYRRLGICLICIDNQDSRLHWQAKSYLAMQHLLRHRYDLVFFDDLFGTGYYPLLARRTGNSQLRETRMCVTTHGAMEWVTELNQISIMNFESLPLMEMERRSVELADMVKAPSAYILRKYNDYGWTVADNFVVLPNFVSDKKTLSQPRWVDDINEIVFFGRVETRKGLGLFCRALDKLKFQLQNRLVTFLGKISPTTAEELVKRSATWPFQIRLISNYDQAQALAYLKGSGRLAVMPSTEDNCPSAILECLEEGIPFLASSGSGGEELLDEPSRTTNLFEPTVNHLCAKLIEVLAQGIVTACPSFDHDQIRRAFAEWLDGAFKSPQLNPRPIANAPLSSTPILIVIIPEHYHLDQAIAELKRTADAFDKKVQIEVLTADAAKFKNSLLSSTRSLPVRITDFDGFADLVTELAGLEPSVLGLCHVSQLIPPVWVERARQCFQSESDISALTGMAGAQLAPGTRTYEPFVSTGDHYDEIERYLVGYAPPLFAITRDTNSGFLLMRSELIRLLCNLPPIDQTYGRLEKMEEWIHKILVTFYKHGRRFELVPDLLLPPHSQRPFEAPRSDHFMRELASGIYGHKAASDQWLITRLAIDTGLKRERTQTSTDYCKYVAGELGLEILPYVSSSGGQWSQLAKIAHACGRIELSLDLTANLAIPGKDLSALNVRERVRHGVKTIRLWDIIRAGRHLAINLTHDWSFIRRDENREIQLHANRFEEGRATLAFAAIDLSGVSAFTCRMCSGKTTAPIRVRIDLIPPKQNDCCSFETMLAESEARNWNFQIPREARTLCKVICSIETTDPGANTDNAYVQMFDPRFILEAGG